MLAPKERIGRLVKTFTSSVKSSMVSALFINSSLAGQTEKSIMERPMTRLASKTALGLFSSSERSFDNEMIGSLAIGISDGKARNLET